MRLQNQIAPRLGRLGLIKVGDKAPNGFPTSIDYFRFTSPVTERVDQIRKVYGDKPKLIRVTFHSDEPGEVCSQMMELRDNAGRLIAYGDGVTFYRSTEKGMVKDDAREAKWQSRYMDGLVSKYSIAASGSKKAFIPAWTETLIVKMVVLGCTELGFWEFRTKAKETTIPQIIGTFDTCLNSWGRVSMVPFNLTVEKHKSNGAEVSRHYPVVNLIPDISVEAAERLLDVGNTIKGLLTSEKLIGAPQLPPPPADYIQEAQIIEE